MKRLIAALALVLLPSLAWGQAATGPYPFHNIGYCQMTSLASAKAVTTANCSTGAAPTQAANVVLEICVSTQSIRYRSDGGTPTASVGIPVAPGTCFQFSGDLRALQIIQVAASATVDIEFFN